ncbi:hypothetical protein HNR06_002448 [Nocardiopsis arvandica]|uniref:DUF2000 domain-containing protein n=1 Tax=Nocardiopsis sinuspersici TaxID=501010 RepID=A0A7Y9XC46_9ACTN|nr:DUF2000 domain-containing protein [Nocardiopsis sinuspersici]NYH52859.1 hypothetical protein [Nocardiopsis sinuspersici]
MSMENEQSPPSGRPRKKIAVVLRDDLENWQIANVTAFLVSGLPSKDTDIIGQEYQGADGVAYLPMFGQPVLVLGATADVLSAAHRRAVTRGMPLSVLTSDLFATGDDTDDRAAVRPVGTDELDLVGIALHGGRNQVDKVVKGTVMYR